MVVCQPADMWDDDQSIYPNTNILGLHSSADTANSQGLVFDLDTRTMLRSLRIGSTSLDRE